MAHSKTACSHEENRHKVCIVCMMKGTRNITETIVTRLRENYISNYDPTDDRLPCAICSKCSNDLREVSNGNKSSDILPDVFDYSVIVPKYVASTRSGIQRLCDCYICEVGRQSGTCVQRHQIGRPRNTDHDNIHPHGPRGVSKLCMECLSPVGRGISHRCNISSLRGNMKSLCSSSDCKTQQQVAGSLIQIQSKLQKSDTIELNTSNRGSLTVSIDKSLGSPPVSVSQLNHLQMSTNLSNTKMKRQVIPFLRDVTGRKNVESFSEIFLQDRDRALSEYFTIHFLKMTSQESSESSVSENYLPIVYCKNVPGIILHVCSKRKLNMEDCSIKIGIDSGGGFLKICLTIYKKDSSSSTLSGGSIKELIIIAIAPELKENYSNMQLMIDLVDLKAVDIFMTYAVDLKMANIIGGIQGHGSTFPCVWCECPKSQFHNFAVSKSYTMRTIGSIKSKSTSYKVSGMVAAEAKDYKNCVQEPLLNGTDHTIIIKILPPPELHLLLRITNRLFKALEQKCPIIAQNWLNHCGIVVPKLHSGEMNGNMCRRLLKKMDYLDGTNEPEIAEFLDVFRAFNSVVQSCFGNALDLEHFKRKIDTFFLAYQQLRIPTTTSVHIAFVHVPQFCLLKKAGLGPFSEQQSESAHSDFNKLWEHGGKVALNHKNFAEKLLDCVVRYNGRHVHV